MKDNTKQVIIVRSDLSMRKGKIASQVAHASLEAVLSTAVPRGDHLTLDLFKHKDIKRWMSGSYAKVVLRCDGEQEMRDIYEKAKKKGLPCSLIVDEGRTAFNGEETLTAVGIGPASGDQFNELTGHLKLL